MHVLKNWLVQQLTLLHDIKANKQPMDSDAQLASLQQQRQLYEPLKIMTTYKHIKLGQTNLFLVCDPISSVVCACSITSLLIVLQL